MKWYRVPCDRVHCALASRQTKRCEVGKTYSPVPGNMDKVGVVPAEVNVTTAEEHPKAGNNGTASVEGPNATVKLSSSGQEDQAVEAPPSIGKPSNAGKEEPGSMEPPHEDTSENKNKHHQNDNHHHKHHHHKHKHKHKHHKHRKASAHDPHTIGGKRFSITPLMTNLDDLNDDMSLSLSEEGEHSDSASSSSASSAISEEESYAVTTSDSDNDDASLKGKRLPFTYGNDSPDASPSEASFDVTKDALPAYDIPTPTAHEVKQRKKSVRKQRRASHRIALTVEERRRNRAATKIRTLLFIRRARLLARFLRANPNLIQQGQARAISIQASWRGKLARKRVAVLRGDYVFNPNLEQKILQHGGQRALLEYIKQLEDENRQLLLDIANMNAKQLLLGCSGANRSQTSNISILPHKSGNHSKKWLLYRRDDELQTWVEQKFSKHAQHRLDILRETSIVRKAGKGARQSEARKKIQEKKIPKVEAVPVVTVLSPRTEVKTIEAKRGIAEDIAVESDAQIEDEADSGNQKFEKEQEREIQERNMVPNAPVDSRNAPETKAVSTNVDVVMRWRLKRGYGFQ